VFRGGGADEISVMVLIIVMVIMMIITITIIPTFMRTASVQDLPFVLSPVLLVSLQPSPVGIPAAQSLLFP
jgi:high-affinity K+ transport system ATPase subunit B